MAAVQHTEDLHIFRLNAMCRICGRRSKAAKDKQHIIRHCKNYASVLFQFHGIQVSEEANGNTFSSTLCATCASRLSQQKKPNIPPQGLSKAMHSNIEKTKVMWTQYNAKVEVADCSVCKTFAEQMAGCRRKTKKVRLRELQREEQRVIAEQRRHDNRQENRFQHVSRVHVEPRPLQQPVGQIGLSTTTPIGQILQDPCLTTTTPHAVARSGQTACDNLDNSSAKQRSPRFNIEVGGDESTKKDILDLLKEVKHHLKERFSGTQATTADALYQCMQHYLKVVLGAERLTTTTPFCQQDKPHKDHSGVEYNSKTGQEDVARLSPRVQQQRPAKAVPASIPASISAQALSAEAGTSFVPLTKEDRIKVAQKVADNISSMVRLVGQTGVHLTFELAMEGQVWRGDSKPTLPGPQEEGRCLPADNRNRTIRTLLETISVNTEQPGTVNTLNSEQPRTVNTLNSEQPRTVITCKSEQPRTVNTLNSEQPQTVNTLNSEQPRTVITCNSEQTQTANTLNSEQPRTVITCNSEQTVNSEQTQTVNIFNSEQPQTVNALNSEQPRTVNALNSEQPRTVITCNSEQTQTVNTFNSEQPRTVSALNSERPRTVYIFNSEQSGNAASDNSMEEGDTAVVSDVKIEIDVAEETPLCWHITEPHPYNSLQTDSLLTRAKLLLSTGVAMSTNDPPFDGSLRVSARMFLKRKGAGEHQSTTTPGPSSMLPIVEEPVISKAAMKMRRYRQRLKEKGKWKEYRMKENAIIKKCKDGMTEEKKKLAKAQAKLRAQRYREKLKEQGLPINPTPKKLTRKSAEDKRQKDCLRQQQYRKNLTPQKKMWVNKRRRDKTAEKAATRKAAMEEVAKLSQPAVPSTPGAGYENACSQRKASKKVRDCLPKSPSKFAAVIDSITNTKSPRKRAALRDRGILPSKARKLLHAGTTVREELESTCKELKKARTRKTRQKIRHACQVLLKAKVSKAALRRRTGISWSVLSAAETKEDVVNKKRKDALPADVEQQIQDFFRRGDVSVEDPLPQNISAKTLEPTRFMEKTLKETYEQFQKEQPDIQICFSKFSSLKPKRMKTISKGKIRACKCEYCCNVELKLQAVNKFLAKNKCETKLGSKYQVMEMTTCGQHPERQVPNKRCLDRSCESCGVSSLRHHLQQALDDHADKIVTWSNWKLVEQTFQNRQGVDVTTTKRGPVDEEGPFDQLVSELESNLEPFALHLANANWQHRQFSLITENLPKNWVVFCMDFAENYTCYFQDEAQSAHWGKQQVTIHPIVAYFTCPEDGEAMKESFIFISEDLNHDSHAVHWFVTQVLSKLTSCGVEMEKVIHFSDGCPSQYKGKTNFLDASFSHADFGVPTEKHFFGSRHGKGPCDAEIGVVKRIIKQDITRKKAVIRGADDLYRSASKTLTKPKDSSEHCHKRRSFLFVPLNTIDRDRARTKDTKALAGSRSLHCVRGMGEYLVSHRERSCFCQPCIQQEGACRNQDFTGEWQEAHLKVRRRANRHNSPEAAAPPPCFLPAAPVPPPDDVSCPVAAPTPPPDNGFDAPPGADTPSAGHDTPGADTPSAGHDTPGADTSSAGHDTPGADTPSAGHDTPGADVSTPTADSITDTETSVKLGDFVLATVFAESGTSSQQFVGCVKALRPDKAGVEVSFLQKKGKCHQYPDKQDEALVLFKDGLNVLHDFTFDSRGHYFFKF